MFYFFRMKGRLENGNRIHHQMIEPMNQEKDTCICGSTFVLSIACALALFDNGREKEIEFALELFIGYSSCV